MGRILLTLGALGLAACDGGAPVAPAGEATDSEIVLFDGTSLGHFAVVGGAEWALEDDTVVSAGPVSGFLLSHEAFGDFRLHAEFFASADANSGIFIRCQDPATITPDSCYEVNIFDRRPDPAYRTGSIVHVAEPLVQIDAVGQWNSFEIEAVGDRLTVHMSGVLTAEASDGRLASGRIALQYAAGQVAFRNVRLERLGGK